MRAFSVAATAKRVYTEPIKLYPPDKTLLYFAVYQNILMRCLWRQTCTDAPVAAFFFFCQFSFSKLKKGNAFSVLYHYKFECLCILHRYLRWNMWTRAFCTHTSLSRAGFIYTA